MALGPMLLVCQIGCMTCICAPNTKRPQKGLDFQMGRHPHCLYYQNSRNRAVQRLDFWQLGINTQ
jgi:hypothetical protein